MKSLVLVLVFLAWLAAPANADFDAGVAAYKSGDYATALRKLRPLAEQGNAEAQLNLGVMYAMGRGVPQDYQEAARWHRRAAEQGYAKAQRHLGLLYHKGIGVPQDYTEALRWYRLAAEQGRDAALSLTGVQHDNGQRAPQDYVLAYIFVAAQKESRIIPDSYLEDIPSKFSFVRVRKSFPADWILVVSEWKIE